MATLRPRDALTAWHRAAAALLPGGTRVWDAHTHTGERDPDGVTNRAVDLVAALDAAGHETAVVCTSADPDGYHRPNHRILEEAARHPGRLVPFLRVDPRGDGAAAAVERGLARGHRGVKLHPRSEQFGLTHPGVHRVAAAAGSAPVLIHAGRGIPSLGRHALELVEAHPELRVILAHCAISDLPLIAAAAHDRVFVDTAWWNPVEHITVFSWIDWSRVVYASDTPYGRPTLSSTLSIRSAAHAGLGAAALEAVFGANLRRLLETGGGAPAAGRGTVPPADLGLQRVAGYLFGAVANLRAGLPPGEPLDLAVRAADRSDGPFPQVHDAIAATLARVPEARDDRRTVTELLVVALAAVHTPGVPVPAPGELAAGAA